MPATTLIFYKEVDDDVPVRQWLLQLRQKNRRAFAKCVDKLDLLRERGHELRRHTRISCATASTNFESVAEM